MWCYGTEKFFFSAPDNAASNYEKPDGCEQLCTKGSSNNNNGTADGIVCDLVGR